jgi:hypothetical protein
LTISIESKIYNVIHLECNGLLSMLPFLNSRALDFGKR